MLRKAAIILAAVTVCSCGLAALAQTPSPASSPQSRTIDKAVDTNISQALERSKARKKSQQAARVHASREAKRIPPAAASAAGVESEKRALK